MTECVCRCACVAGDKSLSIASAVVIGIILGIATLITILMMKLDD